MFRYLFFLLAAVLLISACQPGPLPGGVSEKQIMTMMPGVIPTPTVILTELPVDVLPETTPVFVSTPANLLPPLLFQADPGALPSGNNIQTFRVSVNLAAWETSNAERIRIHLPPSAAVGDISASGWRCIQESVQDAYQPVIHTDILCQNLTMGRTVQSLLVFWIALPLPLSGSEQVCGETAIKDVYSASVCVGPSS